MNVIGIDTSNYTTSIAWYNGVEDVNCSKLLPVRQGELGLRQSDAVFAHIKGLPELSGRLFSHIQAEKIGAVGVSTRPRAVEGSYMPCFLVGYSHAKLLSDLFRVPLVEVSHQQGHVAASLWSAGRLDLMDVPHLAFPGEPQSSSWWSRRGKMWCAPGSAAPPTFPPVSSLTVPASFWDCPFLLGGIWTN